MSKLYFGIPEYSGFSAINATGNNNHAIIATGKLGYAAIYGAGEAADASGTVIGVYGKSYSAGEPYVNTKYIGDINNLKNINKMMVDIYKIRINAWVHLIGNEDLKKGIY